MIKFILFQLELWQLKKLFKIRANDGQRFMPLDDIIREKLEDAYRVLKK